MIERLFEGAVATLLMVVFAPIEKPAEMEFIQVSNDKTSFVLSISRKPFVPWGLNYDHDEQGRLIEDYWGNEWTKIEEDFGEMKELGANLVRVHLQFGRFMTASDKPNETALKQLQRLVELAQRLGLYLDLTGLGCYHKQDVPVWYDALPEQERWAAQAVFWEAIAKLCADSPIIFCYDLMNEPVVSGGPPKDDWLGPAFAGKHFVQYIAIDHADRNRTTIAQQWIEHLVNAIRKHDRRHMVTVGLVPWSLNRPGLTSGFAPGKIAEHLDIISVHVYPESGKLDEAIDTLTGFSVGKPVMVEETFPLKCTAQELDQFMGQSQELAAGWVGFYWGKTIDECRQSGTIVDALTAGWLELFKKKTAEVTK
jgi:hypothetical protein